MILAPEIGRAVTRQVETAHSSDMVTSNYLGGTMTGKIAEDEQWQDRLRSAFYMIGVGGLVATLVSAGTSWVMRNFERWRQSPHG